jgi:hypothetical protein
MDRSEAVERLVEQLTESPDGSLSNRDYLSPYRQDGELDVEAILDSAVNRLFFSLDVLGGEDEKPVWAHVAAAAGEIAFAYLTEGMEDE